MSWFQPLGNTPPRTSLTGREKSGGFPSARSSLRVIPKPQLNDDASSENSRSGSSPDDTKHDDDAWSPENERIVLDPYNYLSQHPGKDIRRQLINTFNAWLKVPSESLTIISKVIEMLHSSSLMIDDVEDSSALRRGVPVAHNIFGTAQTINSANYVYFLALQEVQKLNSWVAIDTYVKELLNLHRGQGMDLFWRDTLTCPSEEEYLQMVENKTGGLFRLAVKLMQAESGSKEDYVSLVNVLGLIFQICDDYLNLSNTTYTKRKGMCEDLTEGKFSFPIIHSIRSDPGCNQLISILGQKTKDEEVKRYAISCMENTNSFVYTREFVRVLRDKALNLIDNIECSESVARNEGVMVRELLKRIVEATLEGPDGSVKTHS